MFFRHVVVIMLVSDLITISELRLFCAEALSLLGYDALSACKSLPASRRFVVLLLSGLNCLRRRLLRARVYSEDEDMTIFQNVCNYLRVYTA